MVGAIGVTLPPPSTRLSFLNLCLVESVGVCIRLMEVYLCGIAVVGKGGGYVYRCTGSTTPRRWVWKRRGVVSKKELFSCLGR